MRRGVPFVLLVILGACLENRPGVRGARQSAALCENAARCGFIGASEEAACADTEGYTRGPFLEMPVLGFETDGYSTAEAVAAGRLAIDSGAEDACLDALASECGIGLIVCHSVYVGRVPEGGACRDDRECVSGLCAVAVGGSGPWSGQPGCAGTCTAFTGGGLPAGCGEGPLCGAGEVCVASESSCRARPGEGERCDFFGAPGGLGGLGGLGAMLICQDGLYCDGEICKVPLGDGDACGARDFCAGGRPCVGLTFDGALGGDVIAEGRCGGWSDEGRACAAGATITGCPYNMECDGKARCVKREVATRRLGEACDPEAFATAERCAEGGCDPSTRTCMLVCSAL